MDGWKRTRHLDWAMINLSTLREKGVTVKEKHVGDFHRKKKPARKHSNVYMRWKTTLWSSKWVRAMSEPDIHQPFDSDDIWVYIQFLFYFCISHILFYGSSLWPDRGIRRKRDNKGRQPHVPPPSPEYIPTYSDGREEERSRSQFIFFFSIIFQWWKYRGMKTHQWKKKELEKQQIQYKQEAIIRKTNHPSQYHRIQHCQVRRRPSSLHPLQSHFHHSLD